MIKPMLCQEPKDKDAELPKLGWVIEPKLDGWRFLFHRTTEGVRSFAGRDGSERTGQPAQIEALLEFLPPDTILDAELIVPGQKSPRVAHALAHGTEMEAVIFDVLRMAGSDIMGVAWERRRKFLEALAEGLDGMTVSISDAQPADDALHQEWLEAGFEGSVAKRTDSLYVPGRRSWDWLKYKPQSTLDAEVIGFIEGKGARTGTWGAFEIRILDSNVVTSVACTIEQSRQAEQYLGRVVEVRHHGIMDSGKPRHPVKPVLREDLVVA